MTQFVGRFHVLLLHLPIGFIVLLAALEALSWMPSFRAAAAANRFIVALALPATLATAVCGWCLSRSGGYDPSLIAWHQWSGVGVAVAVALLWGLHGRGWLGLYRVGLALTLPLLMFASHLGGSLTHGSDFLTQHAPPFLRGLLGQTARPSPDAPARSGATTYEGLVQPVLNEYCTSCHGSSKTKGGLKLDALAGLLQGGDSGPVFVAGRPGESLLLQRMKLPLNNDEHMPPEGKPQPSADHVALLQWWIETGASTNQPISAAQLPVEVQRLLPAQANDAMR